MKVSQWRKALSFEPSWSHPLALRMTAAYYGVVTLVILMIVALLALYSF